ncbi:MAG: sulfur carrier protein ThiS [Bacteroidota bacterium]
MTVYVNQTPFEFATNLDIQALLQHQALNQDKGLAVAVNNIIIPRTNWAQHQLHHDDQVLIISATAGG